MWTVKWKWNWLHVPKNTCCWICYVKRDSKEMSNRSNSSIAQSKLIRCLLMHNFPRDFQSFITFFSCFFVAFFVSFLLFAILLEAKSFYPKPYVDTLPEWISFPFVKWKNICTVPCVPCVPCTQYIDINSFNQGYRLWHAIHHRIWTAWLSSVEKEKDPSSTWYFSSFE